MLSIKSCHAVSTASAELADRGLCLSAVGDTPLQLLVEECTPPAQRHHSDDNVMSVDNSATLLHSSGQVDFSGVNVHGVILEEYLSKVGDGVATTVDVARNHVNPMTEEVVKAIEEALDRVSQKKNAFNIHVVRQPKIMKNVGLDEMTSRFAGIPGDVKEWRGNQWPEMEAAQLREALTPTVRRIASDLKEFVNGIEDDALVAVYDFIFRRRPIVDVVNQTELAVLGFFWSSKWLDELPEGIESDLAAVTGHLTDLMADCGYKIQSLIGRFSRAVKYNNYLLKMPSRDNRSMNIEVVGEVYSRWLENGGSPELLIGSALAGLRLSFNITETERKVCTRAYNNDLRAQEYSINTRIKESVTLAVRDHIYGIVEDFGPDAKADARELYREFIQNNPYRTDGDVQKWARELVISLFYPNTNALMVLTGIDEIMSKDESISPREAATFASLDVVADYLVSMMDVKYV